MGYNSKHSGRKLRWMYTMGQVEINCKCFPKRHTLVVSTYQCLALMIFNKQNEVTLREICEATKLPKDECKRQVMSLTVSKQKVLTRDGAGKELEDDTNLEVNETFPNDKLKVVISL